VPVIPTEAGTHLASLCLRHSCGGENNEPAQLTIYVNPGIFAEVPLDE
jgi:hypothetical protein